MRINIYGVVALTMLLGACGSTTAQRAATGGLTGAGIGALAGGPVGLVIGGAAGAAAGGLMTEGVDKIASNYFHHSGQPKTAAVSQNASPAAPSASAASGTSLPPPRSVTTAAAEAPEAASLPITPELARHIQTILKDQGFYEGPIDGIIGRETKSALAAYQTRHGLPATAVVDQDTMEMLASNDGSLSGSSAPVSSQPVPAPGSGPDDPRIQGSAPNK